MFPDPPRMKASQISQFVNDLTEIRYERNEKPVVKQRMSVRPTARLRTSYPDLQVVSPSRAGPNRVLDFAGSDQCCMIQSCAHQKDHKVVWIGCPQ